MCCNASTSKTNSTLLLLLICIRSFIATSSLEQNPKVITCPPFRKKKGMLLKTCYGVDLCTIRVYTQVLDTQEQQHNIPPRQGHDKWFMHVILVGQLQVNLFNLLSLVFFSLSLSFLIFLFPWNSLRVKFPNFFLQSLSYE